MIQWTVCNGYRWFGKSILQVPDTGTSQYWWILEHFWCTSIAWKCDIYVLWNVLVLFRSLQYWNAKMVQYCPILMYQYLGLQVYFFRWFNWPRLGHNSVNHNGKYVIRGMKYAAYGTAIFVLPQQLGDFFISVQRKPIQESIKIDKKSLRTSLHLHTDRAGVDAHPLYSCSPRRVSRKLWTVYETVSSMQQLRERYASRTCYYARASLWHSARD